MKPKLITKLGRERLVKMIAYLRVLPEEFFDFSIVASGRGCGTVGCVIGHTPNVFPELCSIWKGAESTFSVCFKGDPMHYAAVGEELFGMDFDVADELFSPDAQEIDDVHLNRVWDDSTPADVADMLQSFLDQVDNIEESEVPA